MSQTQTASRKSLVLVSIGAALLISILVFVMQLPSFSVRGLLIGDRVVSASQFWILEFLAGVVVSVVITGIALALFRRRYRLIFLLSVSLQLLWVVMTQTFVTPANSIIEAALRSSEAVGLIVGAAIALLVARGIAQLRAAPVTS